MGLRNASNVQSDMEMLTSGDKLLLTCKELCSIVAPSGREMPVLKYITNALFQYGYLIEVDKIGNLIAHKKLRKHAKNIALFAHMDSAGVIITRKSLSNELLWGSLSSWTKEKINNQPVIFDNGEEGIILYSEDATEKRVVSHSNNLSVGAIGAFKPTIKIENDYLIGTFLDDRVGCAILINLAKQLSTSKDNIFFVFTTQEEVGNKGAMAVVNSHQFDESYIIDTTKCDVSSLGEGYVNLGYGPTYKVCDGAGLCSIELISKIRTLQEEYKIKMQIEILTYAGSDIAAFRDKGDRSLFLGLSLPCDRMHTREEIVALQDLIGLFNLLKLLLRECYGAKYHN